MSPLVNIGGRPVPVGDLATASVIQYDPADPADDIVRGKEGQIIDTNDGSGQCGGRDSSIKRE